MTLVTFDSEMTFDSDFYQKVMTLTPTFDSEKVESHDFDSQSLTTTFNLKKIKSHDFEPDFFIKKKLEYFFS